MSNLQFSYPFLNFLLLHQANSQQHALRVKVARTGQIEYVDELCGVLSRLGQDLLQDETLIPYRQCYTLLDHLRFTSRDLKQTWFCTDVTLASDKTVFYFWLGAKPQTVLDYLIAVRPDRTEALRYLMCRFISEWNLYWDPIYFNLFFNGIPDRQTTYIRELNEILVMTLGR